MKDQQPTLPELFTPPGLLPPPATVRCERDAAMTTVAQHAEAHRSKFLEDAQVCVVGYLRSHGPTHGEVLTMACKAAGIVPHDDRAFGPVYWGLSKRGVIEKVGTATRRRGHGTSGGNVWAVTSAVERC